MKFKLIEVANEQNQNEYLITTINELKIGTTEIDSFSRLSLQVFLSPYFYISKTICLSYQWS